MINHIARARARETSLLLRTTIMHAFIARWWAFLSCTQQNALAATLVNDAVVLLDGADSALPDDFDALQEHLRI